MSVVRVYQYGKRLRFVEIKYPYEKMLDVAEFLSDSAVGFDSSLSDVDKDNSARMLNNISRARSTVRELAFCNPWEYFVTITINKANQDRSNLSLFKSRLNQCVKDYNQKFKTALKYLLVPELHSDNENWHMHGLMMGLASDSILSNSNGYPTIPYFEKRFGWVSIDPVRNADKTASYVTKYISKTLASGDKIRKGEHLFLCSKGLERAQLIWQDSRLSEFLSFDFENDYVRIAERTLDFEDFFRAFEAKLRIEEGDSNESAG